MGEAEERIRKTVLDNATMDARSYFLISGIGRYPTVGGWALSPFELPIGAITGSYRVGYLDAAGNTTEPRFAATTPRLDILAELPATPPRSTTTANSAKATEALLATNKRHVGDLVDFSRERMADEILENRQLLSKKLRLAHDQAEQLVLGRAYRHELAAQMLTNTSQQQRTAELLEKLQQLLMTVVDQQLVVETRRVETLAKTAGPPPQGPGVIGNLLSIASELAPLLAALFGGKAKAKAKGVIDAMIDDDDNFAKMKSEVKTLRNKVRSKAKQQAKRDSAGTSDKKKATPKSKKEKSKSEKSKTPKAAPRKQLAGKRN